jgi:hypothetical protein
MSTGSYSMADIESFVARFWPGRKTYITPYAYPATFTALAQNGQQTQNINIQANADFLLLGIAFRANIAAAQTESSVTAPFVRMLIVDTGSNEQFTNAAVDLEAMYRNAQRSVYLPYPRIIQGRSSLSLQATNYSPGAGETYSFDIILEGVHVRAYS